MTSMTSKFSIFCLIFLLALATIQTVAADLSLSGNTIEFDFSTLEDREDELVKTQSITIFNNGTTNESVSFSVSSTNDLFSVELDDISDSSFTLNSGSTRTIVLSITADVSAGIDPEEYSDVVRVTAVGSTTTFIDLNTSVESMLNLDRVVFHLDDKFESRMDEADESDSDEDVVVIPGQTVRMYFLLENLFDKDFDDGDIDGTITVTLDGNDFDDDIDEEVDFDISVNDETVEGGNIYVEFEVPLTAKDDVYDLEIEVDASDENGADYLIEWTAELSVEREDDDVRIDSLSVNPSTVSCSRTVTVTVDVFNYGSDRQRNSKLTLENTDLNLFLEESFSLGYGYDEDENSESVEFTFSVPTSQTSGTYELRARAYYSNDDTADLKLVDLVVGNCVAVTIPEPVVIVETTEPVTDPVPTPINEVDNTNSITGSVTGGNVVNTVEKVYTLEDVMVALIITLILLLLAIIILVAVVGVKVLIRK